MTRRTKIVATLGPASRRRRRALERLLRAGVDVVPAQPQPRPARRAPRPLGDGPRRRAPTSGARSAVLADLPGPEDPRRAVPRRRRRPARPAATCALVPGDGPSTGERDLRRLPDAARRRRRRRPGRARRRRRSRCASSTTTPTRVVAEVESGGRTQGRPGVHLPCERLRAVRADRRGPRARRGDGRRRRRLHRPVVRRAAPPTSTSCARVVGDRARIVAKIETAAALGELAEITDAADAVMVARGDLGIDCPLEDVPAPAEADHPPLRRGRRAGRSPRRRCSSR